MNTVCLFNNISITQELKQGRKVCPLVVMFPTTPRDWNKPAFCHMPLQYPLISYSSSMLVSGELNFVFL